MVGSPNELVVDDTDSVSDLLNDISYAALDFVVIRIEVELRRKLIRRDVADMVLCTGILEVVDPQEKKKL